MFIHIQQFVFVALAIIDNDISPEQNSVSYKIYKPFNLDSVFGYTGSRKLYVDR